MVKAIIYQTGNDGAQKPVAEIGVRNGHAVAVNDHPLARYIVGRSVVDYRHGELDAGHGERFILALPAAYSGQRLRVGVEETEKGFGLAEKFNPNRDDPDDIAEKLALEGELILQKSSELIQKEAPQPVFNINVVVPPDSIRVVVEQQVPNIQVNVPEQPAPVINVESQPVNVEVKVPEQPAPNVTVEAPVVNVTPQIDVIVPQKRKPKKATITHSDGSTSEIEVE